MEHRTGERLDVALPALVRTRRGPPLQGEVLNLSAGGAFIRLHGEPPMRGFVQLSIGDGEQWWALVVHATRDGVGVMFDRHRFAAVARLIQDTGRVASAARRPAQDRPGLALRRRPAPAASVRPMPFDAGGR